jgi:hypothetical protein
MTRILVVLVATRPRATGTPELTDTEDALKLDDIEDAVVGPLRSGASLRPPPLTRNGFDLGCVAPVADQIIDRFGRGTARP